MIWTAPEVERPSGALDAGEREMLRDLLAWHRSTLVYKCAGLTAEQLAVRPVASSDLSLLGLVRHMTDVERIWFRRLVGEPMDFVHKTPERKNADFEDAEAQAAEADYARLLEEWQQSDKTADAGALDDTFDHNGEPLSLRFVYLHLIGEYARHNGHADLVRELVDGTTGA